MNPTKKTLLLIFAVCFNLFMLSSSMAQVSPTLGVGLSELTMKKGTIDVEVLTEIIIEKQKELKKEALKRFLFDRFPAGNFATKYYIQNCIYTLMNEKNPQVIKKEIMELTTNYSIALGLAVVYDCNSLDYDLQDPAIRKLLTQINSDIKEGCKINKFFQLSDTISGSLDYKLLVDIVSLSLSNSEKIRNKGFYKNSINYMQGRQYFYLTRNSPSMRENLKNLGDKITAQIDKYILNYDIIQEFYTRYKGTKSRDIKDALLKDYNNEILALYSNSSFSEVLLRLSPDKKLNPAFLTYSIDIESYNIKKKQNDNFSSLKTNLTQLIDLLKQLNQNNIKLNVAADLIKHENFALKEDSLINPKEIQKKLQNSTLSALQNDNLQTQITYYNDNKAVNLDLQKKIYESKNNITAISKFTLKTPSLLDNKNLDNIEYLQKFLNDLEDKSVNYTADEITIAENKVKADLTVIFQQDDFLHLYLRFLLNNLLNKQDLILGLDLKTQEGLGITKEYSESVSSFYAKLETIANKNSVTIADINYIEKQIIPQFLKFSILAEKSDITKTITNLRILNNLLKLKIINDANSDGGFEYNAKLNNIFTFISNLDKLNKVETYQSVISLIQENNENVAKCLPTRFQPIYTLFINGIKKYTLLNTNEQYIEVDVVSFLNDLQLYYNKENKSWFSLYFTLGISENFFPKSLTLPGSTKPIDNIGFASEKLGLQFTCYSFGKDRQFKNMVKDKVYTNNKNPFINKIYCIVYASGLLYTLANTTTNENFDFPHLGIGGGLRFYNALDFNISYALPFIDGQKFGKNGFFSIGLDIPLGEYLERLGKK